LGAQFLVQGADVLVDLEELAAIGASAQHHEGGAIVLAFQDPSRGVLGADVGDAVVAEGPSAEVE
jgi:hypothetical protein